jgi:hypothetical protein
VNEGFIQVKYQGRTRNKRMGMAAAHRPEMGCDGVLEHRDGEFEILNFGLNDGLSFDLKI